MKTFEDKDFPIYRKYANGMRYYKIMSWDSFEEVQKIGSRYIKHVHKVEQYPEKLFIRDLLGLSQEGIVVSTQEEFESAM
jgi:hypothetical protein